MNKQDWLLARQTGIGGSDAPAVLGLSRYRTPYDVFIDKTTEPEEISLTPVMRAGIKLESVVAEYYAEESGNKVINSNKILKHKKIPFLIGNVDRIILSPKGRGILECKTTSSYYVKTWKDEIPIEYYCQLQHYLNVTGYNYGVVAVLIDGREFKYFEYVRDEEFISSMTEKLIIFWVNNIQKNIPPEPINSEDIVKMYPISNGQAIEATNETYYIYERLKELKTKGKELDDEIKKLEESLKLSFGENDTLMKNGQVLATYRNINSSWLFDKKRFEKENNELYNKYLIEGKPQRRLSIK